MAIISRLGTQRLQGAPAVEEIQDLIDRVDGLRDRLARKREAARQLLDALAVRRSPQPAARPVGRQPAPIR